MCSEHVCEPTVRQKHLTAAAHHYKRALYCKSLAWEEISVQIQGLVSTERGPLVPYRELENPKSDHHESATVCRISEF